MTITELINKLEAIRATEGDLRVTIFDDYTANEGYGYTQEELFLDVNPVCATIAKDDGTSEKVVDLSDGIY